MNDASHGGPGPLIGPTTRRQVLKTAAVTSAGLGTAGLLAGCLGDDSDGGATTSGDTASQNVKKGGTLRVGVDGGGDPKETLDAHTPALAPAIAAVSNIYDPLARWDVNHELKMLVAESIEPKTASEWIIKLRPDVEFHNGKTVDADDVIFTIRRILDPNTAGSIGAGSLGSVDPKKLKKLDARTVSVGLNRPEAQFPSFISDYWGGVVPVGYDPKKPIGAGPFRAGTFTPGKRLVLERFENYHGEAAYLDSVELSQINDAGARVNALLAGQVDAMTGVQATQLGSLEGTSGFEILNQPTGTWIPFLMHVEKQPFSDVKVRQAMRLIVDREAMIQQAVGGQAEVANDIWGRNDPAYASDIPQRVQDIEQAKSLLNQAGQSDLRVELVVAPDVYNGLIESGQVLVEQAKAAGVTIQLTKMDLNAWFAKYTTWPFTSTLWGSRDYLPQAAQIALPGAIYPETGWSDPEWTRIVEEARGTLDEAKRTELIHEAQRIDHERGAYIIWGWTNQIDAHSNKVGGIVAGPDATFGYGNFGFRTMGFVA